MTSDVPTTSPTRVVMLTTTEAADWLGISVRMVHHYTRPTVGRLIPDRRIGRAMLFTPTTLSAFHQELRGAA